MIETKLNGMTPDIAEENIAKLKEIFPDVFCEGKVDFEKLQQVLGNYVEDAKERYNFSWNGKGKSLKLAQSPSTGTLLPCKEESKDWDTTENLYIEGDNLEVLKLLQKSYHNKIKMIYIDPPYNTGHDFVYKDNFKDNLQNYLEITGQTDEDGNKMTTNSESNGRYHTDWLNMMYPRLRLARNLLTDDGVIFISINDKEMQNLKKLCSEIFGEDNEIAVLIWDKNHSAQAGIYKVYHEYILVYCKNIDNVSRPSSLSNDVFEAGAMKKVSGRHPLTEFTFPAGTRFDAPDGTVLEGEYGDVEKVYITKGKMIAKDQKLVEEVTLQAGFTQANQMRQYFYGDKDSLVDSQGQRIIEFYFNSTGKIKIVKERGVETPQTTCKFGTQGAASTELSSLFELDDCPFSAPKPVSMLTDFIQRFTESGDIILDFFSGSATTAHATFEVNSNSDCNDRKFILVQLDEDLDESLKIAQKDAVKTLEVAIEYLSKKNLPHKITEIGKERIRRAGDKIKSEIKAANVQIALGEDEKKVPDIGFKVFKLNSSNIKKWQPDFDEIEDYISFMENNFVDNRTQLDVVYEIMIKYGLDLTYPVEELSCGETTLYSIGMGMLIICLENNIGTDIAKFISDYKKENEIDGMRVVFADGCFGGNDSLKTNIKEILKVAGVEEFITI